MMMIKSENDEKALPSNAEHEGLAQLALQFEALL